MTEVICKKVRTSVKGDVEPGRDDTSLVQSSVELNDNLSTSVVIDALEFTNVSCKAIAKPVSVLELLYLR